MKFKLPKPTVYEIEKKEYKRFIILNAALFAVVAILISIFVYKNYIYIINPELSPYCNLGVPFGDGHPEFEFWGIKVPRIILYTMFTSIFLFCLSNFYTSRRIIMLCFFVLIILLYFTLINDSLDAGLSKALGILYGIVFPFAILYYFLIPLAFVFACPILIIFLCVLLLKKKKKGALQIGILFFSWFAQFAFTMFDTYLFLD